MSCGLSRSLRLLRAEEQNIISMGLGKEQGARKKAQDAAPRLDGL
jgi:hypothetical protein